MKNKAAVSAVAEMPTGSRVTLQPPSHIFAAVKFRLRRRKTSVYDKSVITKRKTKGGIKMLYNSYAVTSYTYEDYKKTSYSRTSSSYSSSKSSASALALKILAVIVMVIVAVTAGLNFAPSAEKVSASNTSANYQQSAQVESNTIWF